MFVRSGGSRRTVWLISRPERTSPAAQLQGVRLHTVFKFVRPLALGAIAAVPACDSTGPDREVWPLAVGAQWIYRVTVADSAGATLFSYRDTLAVVADTIVDGEQWFVTTRTPIMDHPLAKGLLTNRPDGLWYWEVSTATILLTGSDPGPYFLYPARVGDVYMPDPTLFQYPLRVTAVEAPCETPAGRWQCVEYTRREAVPWEWVYRVAPGVGFVFVDSLPELLHDSLNTSSFGYRRIELVERR